MNHGHTSVTGSVTLRPAGSQQGACRRKPPWRALLVLVALSSLAPPARAEGPPPETAPVLRAGQEPVVGRLLALDPEATGGLGFTGASVDRDRIVARYTDPAGREVTALLVHPSAAAGAPQTAHLAVTVPEGDPLLPGALVAALLASADVHGGDLVWTVPEPTGRPPRDWPIGSPFVWLVAGLTVAGASTGLRHWRFREATLSPPRRPIPAWTRLDTALLVLLTLGALGLRIIHLEARPLEPDEEAVLGPVPGPTRWAEETHDARFKPPLYGQIARIATRQTSDIVAARWVSTAAGLGTVALAFVVVRRRVGREGACFAALLVATAGSAVFVSGLARGYALLALCLLAAHAALHRALARGGGAWDLYVACAILAMLTDYLALAPLLAEAAVVVLGPARPRAVRIAAGLAFCTALAAVAFLVPVAWPSLAFGLAPEPLPRVSPAGALHHSGLALAGGLPALGLAALIGLAIATVWRGGLAERCLLAAAAAVVAANVLGSLAEAVRPRYVLHALPLLAVALAAGVAPLPAIARRLLLAALVISHAALLSDLYGRRCDRMEVCTASSIDRTLAFIRLDIESGRADAVIFVPRHRMSDSVYRLHGTHLGRESVQFDEPFPPGRDTRCPVRLCFPTADAPFYGSDADGAGVTEALSHHVSTLLLVREDATLPIPPTCDRVIGEAEYTLYRCAAP